MSVGPSLSDLSPLKPRPQIPVLPSLYDDLVQAVDHPVDAIAYALATCSGYAYSDAETVAMMMARMGLFHSHCAEIKLGDDALFIDSTAYLVQSEDGRVVVLCYRGTLPLKFIDWLLDADLDPEKISLQLAPDGTRNTDHWVHSGFYRNMRATRHKVVQALEAALRGESVLDGSPREHPMEALYITGHSLGGAMAALMALVLHVEPAYQGIREKLRAVYTFGQPMVGPPAVAEFCRRADLPPLIRYVHRRDVVPHIPPRDSGLFEHFGVEYQYHDREETWKPATLPTLQVNPAEFAVLAPTEFVTHKIAALRGLSTVWNGVARRYNDLPSTRIASILTRELPFGDAFVRLPLVYSFDDHVPNHYISKLAPRDVMSEFGDLR
jgi:hypothetical protein